MKPVSDARRRRDADYDAARRTVAARNGGMCEAVWDWNVCAGQGGEAHHVEGRNVPDPHAPERLLWVCPDCHRAIHANPAESRRRGFMRSRLGPVRRSALLPQEDPT